MRRNGFRRWPVFAVSLALGLGCSSASGRSPGGAPGDHASPTAASPSTAGRASPGPAPQVPGAMPRVAHAASVMGSRGAASTLAVSGLGPAVVAWSRGGDTGPGDGNVQDGWDARLSDPALGGRLNNAVTNGPVDYVVEASAGGDAWTPLVTVTGNSYIARAHRVNLTGFTSVRLRLTSAPRRPGAVYLTEVAVHDARSGADDLWLFLGDSITTNVFSVHDSREFGRLVHAARPGRWPVALEGGISQARIADFLWTGWQGSDGRPLLARWLDDFPGRFVSLGIGTNDINGGTSTIDAMDAGFRRLVALVQAAGKTPVIPTLRWNSVGGADMPLWHRRLDAIIADTGALRGPDLYTRSLAQGRAGLRDPVHLNAAGAALTQADWVSWATGTVYR